MSENTAIEWTDSTFNPWEGCQKVGPGCDHCYAETRNARFGGGVAVNWGPGAPRRRTSVQNWNLPKRWNNREFFQCGNCGLRSEGRPFMDFGPEGGAGDHGAECPRCDSRDMDPVRRRVFCASLADVFDNAVDPAWRDDLWSLIRETPTLDWLLLTKRIGNVIGMLPMDFNPERYANVWLGATVVNQAEADRDIPKLLAVNARVRFLSIEPLLGPVDLRVIDINGDAEIYPLKGTTECVDDEGAPAPDMPAIDWVIVGGESGPGARPMNPDWARGLRDQCVAAGVPLLFKQWGEWATTVPASHPSDPDIYVCTDGRTGTEAEAAADGGSWAGAWKVGKKAAGRQLDARTHDGFPEVL